MVCVGCRVAVFLGVGVACRGGGVENHKTAELGTIYINLCILDPMFPLLLNRGLLQWRQYVYIYKCTILFRYLCTRCNVVAHP